MKRTYFYLGKPERQALAKAVKAKGGSTSEFVRLAVQEKIDRDSALEDANQVKDELTSLVDELRDEISRVRRDVQEDTQRGIALIREDAARSMRKTEEMQKTFVMALAGNLAQETPAIKSSRRDDDGPRAIPG